jgi:hypothetical protein
MKRQNKRFAIVYVIAIILTCSCTTSGTFNGPYKGDPNLPSSISTWGTGVVLHDDQPSLLLTIEYPGGITQQALTLLRNKRRSELAIVGAVATSKLTDDYVDQRVMDQINKSGYYALQVFSYLQRTSRFPAETLALRSVTIDVDPESPSSLRVVRNDVPIPSILTLRFLVFRHLFDVTDGAVTVNGNTFANFVEPEFALVTEGAAWPATGGAILSTGMRWWTGGSLTFSCAPQTCLANAEDISDMIEHEWRYLGPVPASTILVEEELAKDAAALPYPRGVGLHEILIEEPPGVALATQQMPVGGDPQNNFNLGRYIEHVCIQGLSQVNGYLATRMQWKNYIRLFDPGLADRWPNTELTSDEARRLMYIKKIMRAERGLVSQQSVRFSQAMANGPAGDALRKQFGAEYRVMQELQAADHQAFLQNLLSLTSFMNTQLATHSAPGRLTNTLGFTQTFIQQASLQNAKIDAIESQFAINYQQPLAQPDQETLVFDDEKITVAAIESLRTALVEKYRRRFSKAASLPAPRCADTSDGGFITKQWTGLCAAPGAISRERSAALGETYYERDNGNNAFVETSEVTMKNGALRGPAFSYNDCFYVNTLSVKQPSKVDYAKCISVRSPRAVLDSILLAGARPRFGVTTASEADYVVLERSAVFHLYGETNVMEITWSFKGVQYSVTDLVAKKVRIATPEERAQLDAGWVAWKASRDRLVSYDEVH